MNVLSMFDIIQNGLKIAGRATYLHRIIYIGKHNFDENFPVYKAMETVINKLHSSENYNVLLTGLLIYYPKYFVHILDGCSYTLLDHMELFKKMYGNYLEEMKVLIMCHHINQRFFSTWGARTGIPPVLNENINTNSLKEVMHHVENCVMELYDLAVQLRSINDDDPENIMIGEISESMTDLLPEYNLLEFLLKSERLQSGLGFIQNFHNVPEMQDYNDMIWPVQEDLVPYDVFDEPVDPIEDSDLKF